jgi:hypothetical protein
MSIDTQRQLGCFDLRSATAFLWLKPGVLMQVELLRNLREALVVPESSLLQQGRDHFVMRVGQGDKVERRQAGIGTRRPGKVEVIEGLTAGERVISHGNDHVRPGQQVKDKQDIRSHIATGQARWIRCNGS